MKYNSLFYLVTIKITILLHLDFYEINKKLLSVGVAQSMDLGNLIPLFLAECFNCLNHPSSCAHICMVYSLYFTIFFSCGFLGVLFLGNCVQKNVEIKASLLPPWQARHSYSFPVASIWLYLLLFPFYTFATSAFTCLKLL